MTRLITVMHNLLGTPEKVAGLLARALVQTGGSTILDLCSGSGGAMPEVLHILQKEHGLENTRLLLTDLYPDLETAVKLNGRNNDIRYLTTPVDAARLEDTLGGLRTMVGSFHHMTPPEAREILVSAQKSGNPICIFEISDNRTPVWLWWIAVPINFIMTLFITPLVRPITWQQLVFTYLIPVIPACFAWDGAVSNARTYTLADMEELLKGLDPGDYTWEKGRIEGRTNQLYLLGMPNTDR